MSIQRSQELSQPLKGSCRKASARVWPLTALALALSLGSCARQPAPAVQAVNTGGAEEQESLWSEQPGPADAQIAMQALSAGPMALSSLPWLSASSGYGPIERNKSNGEKAGGDGHTLTLDGKTFSSGFGVHSNSKMVFQLPADAQMFSATVGVDDEVGKRGSVVFQVYVDGIKAYDSGTMTGLSASAPVSVSVAGKHTLTLAVTDAGNGLSYDHADWADAKLTSAQTPAASLIAVSSGSVPSGDKRFPADAVINVAQYGAIPDDGKDDTAALQKAISANVGKLLTLYLPSGTYNVSNTLVWKNAAGLYGAGVSLQGQNQANTIIKLDNGAFGNAQKAVLYTASNSADNKGQGNMGFGNSISDLTIDTGAGNAGASGIDYVANNSAAIRDVTIRSADGAGQAGLALVRAWPGPMLIKNVQISGFNYGVQVKLDAYTQTFENLSLSGQHVAGIQNSENVLNIRRLNSVNSVPAIVGSDPAGVITLLDSNLSGGAGNVSAIDNLGTLYARNVESSGYASALKQKGVVLPGNSLSEYSSEPRNDANGLNSSFRLNVEETPEYHDNNLQNWANVASYRTNWSAERDDSDAIQAAIDSGKSTIYFPADTYRLGKTVHIRGNVRQLIGIGAKFDIATGTRFFSNANSPQPALKVEAGSDPLLIDSFVFADWNNSAAAGLTWIEQASSRPLVLRDLNQMAQGGAFYRNSSGAGKLFIENVATILPWRFDAPQDVWARQFNPENHDVAYANPLISKNGGNLWILGLKSEDPRTVLSTNGGAVELLGGLLYPVTRVPRAMPAFVSSNTKLKLSYTTLQYSNPEYQIHVKDGADSLLRGVLPINNHHAVVPLYLSRAAAPVTPGSGSGLRAEYYDNAFFTGNFTNLKTVRTDPGINFDWGHSIPSGTGLTNKDTISVRWTGQLQPAESGNYRFSTANDQWSKVTLWVNGQQMDNGNGSINLSAGQKYSIRVDYAHMNYSASIKLAWSLNGASPQIIPAQRLFPANQ